MAGVYKSVEQLVGGTPMLRAERLEKKLGLKAGLYLKLEMFNPAGSAKDRVALSMLNEAESNGSLKQGGTIIEPTSGNTGIGLACIGVLRGYRVIIVMPDTMSVERRRLMTAYGAELVLSDGALGMKGAIAKAQEIAKATENSVVMGQFENPANPLAHYNTTGPEIYEALNGDIDCFVAGVGTGGTITGVGRYLKENCRDVEIVGVEPASSAVLSGGKAGAHGLQGIGAGFVPDALDVSVLDRVVTVTEQEAYENGRLLAKTEGVLCGISSGAALCAAIGLAAQDKYAGKSVVALLPDTGERYLSSEMFK